jgi:hypothetical protein
LLGARDQAAERGTGQGGPALLVKALATRRGDATARPYVEAMRRAQPAEPAWAVHAALIALATGDTASADSMLAGVLRRSRHAGALLVAGLLAVQRNEDERAERLLDAALRGGADSGAVRAGLAVLRAREQRWADVAAHVRGTLEASRATFRRPFPRELLSDAVTPLALEGPPDTALAVLGDVIVARPGWARLYELMGVAAVRAGSCELAADAFVRLLDFGVLREDGPALVEQCRRRSSLLGLRGSGRQLDPRVPGP